jgi:hypothetical protein
MHNLIPDSMSDVAKKPKIDHLVPFEIDPQAKERWGEEPDPRRVEEIRRRGIRPDDARRIERVERAIDLDNDREYAELRRVWAAAVLQANPETSSEALRRVMVAVRAGDLLPYDALMTLRDLELVPDKLDFARADEATPLGTPKVVLVMYEGHEAAIAAEYNPKSETARLINARLSNYYDDLPE